MQSTGQTSTHEPSLTPTHGLVITYVMEGTVSSLFYCSLARLHRRQTPLPPSARIPPVPPPARQSRGSDRSEWGLASRATVSPTIIPISGINCYLLSHE